MTDDKALFGHLPAPGEPITAKVAESNQLIIEKDLAQRKEILRAKLTKREHRRLTARLDKIRAQLARKNYRALFMKRAEIWEQYQMVKAAYERKPTPALRERGHALARDGKALNEQLAPLEKLANEFSEIANRLDDHQRVVDFEREEAENRAAFYREAEVWEEQIKAVFRRSPRLRHVFKDRDGREHIRIPIIQRVLIQPDKISFIIATSHQNAFMRFFKLWDWLLPEGVDIKSLTCEETLENLSAACGRVVTAEQNQITRNVMYVVSRLDSADGIPNKILYEQVRDFYPDEKHARTPWPGGVTKDRKIVFFDFEEYPHLLIGGASGGGKSNMINQILATLITHNSPDELNLFLFDLKGGVELFAFHDVPHLHGHVIKRESEVVNHLKYIREIMTQRQAAFEGVARDFISYNAKAKLRGAATLPRIVVVFDEMSTIMGLGAVTKEIHQEMAVLSSQGRAFGINLIFCTQHPTVEVIPGRIKTNMTLRAASKMPNNVASQVVIDSISAALLPDIPGRMIFRRGGFEVTVQTPLITDTVIDRAVTFAKERWPKSSAPSELPAAPPPIEVVNRFTRENLLDMALNDFGGKLSATRTHEVIGNEVMGLAGLRVMVNALVSEIEKAGGVLEYKGERYQLSKDRKAHLLKRIDAPNELANEPEPVNQTDTKPQFDYTNEGETAA